MIDLHVDWGYKDKHGLDMEVTNVHGLTKAPAARGKYIANSRHACGYKASNTGTVSWAHGNGHLTRVFKLYIRNVAYADIVQRMIAYDTR